MRRIISFLLILMAIVANARLISPNEAQSVANDFFGTSNGPKHVSQNGIKRVAPKDATAEYQPYYIFNAAENAGFVIISGDDRARKILGYSDKGEFDFNNLPPQLDWLLNEYGKQIESIPASASQDPSWLSTDTPAEGEGVLLETANWGQGYPYNAQCPIIDGVQAPTGCVATAMAIVMKYHNWPEKCHGKHVNASNNELSMDFENTTFDWSKISSEEESVDEISKLFYAAGIAVDMNYGKTESGAETTYISNVMNSRFNFGPTSSLYRSDYQEAEWNEIIKKEIDENRVILYCGFGTGGHEFVVDGYNSDNLFHINWGWDGLSNGYFQLNPLSVDNLDFSSNQNMVIGISPNRTNIRYSSFGLITGKEVFGEELVNYNFGSSKIEKGEPFCVVLPDIYGDCRYDGLIALALIDENNNFIELVDRVLPNQEIHYTDVGDENFHSMALGCEGIYIFECGQYKAPKYMFKYQLGGLGIKSDIKPGYRLQLVARESPTSPWEYICDTPELQASIQISGNVPSEWVDVEIDVDEDYVFVQPYDSYTTKNKALKNAAARWRLVFGNGELVYDSNSTIPWDPQRCLDDGKYEIAEYFNGKEKHLFKADYIPKSSRIESDSELSESQFIVDGLVYEIIQPDGSESGAEPYAIVIGYSEEKESVTLVDTVEKNGVKYMVRYVANGAFAWNTTLKHINLNSKVEMKPCALCYLPNIESLTVDCFDYFGAFYLLHKSSVPKYLYEIGEEQLSEEFNQICATTREDYLDNENNSIAPKWYIEDINKSIPFVYICLQGVYPPIFYVPGGYQRSDSRFPIELINEMWKYEIDRKNGKIKIEPIIEELVIDKITINGKEFSVSDNHIYDYTKTSESLDVVVNYTLHERQAMTTHYDAEFNAQIPDTELSLPVSVASIEITPASVQGEVGTECQLTATVMPENATNKAVEWSSDNTEVAAVDANGLLSLLSQGTATITATAADGSGVQAQCTVIVDTPTGIENVLIDADTEVKIYSTTGVLLFEGKYSDAKLDEGIYVVVTPDKQFKRLIK